MNLTRTIIGTCAACMVAGTVNVTAAEPEKKIWDNGISLGLTLTKGNSDTLQAVANWLSVAKWDKNELRLGADASYGEDHSKANAQTLHGFIQYNRLFTERFYGYARVDGFHDRFADIDYRFTLSPGAGYYFIKNDRTLLSGEVGPGYVWEKKGGDERDYMTIRFAERFEQKLWEKAKLWQSLEFLPEVTDWGNYVLNFEIGIESPLSKSLSLRVFLQDTYTSEPAPGRDENDIKLVSAIAYKF